MALICSLVLQVMSDFCLFSLKFIKFAMASKSFPNSFNASKNRLRSTFVQTTLTLAPWEGVLGCTDFSSLFFVLFPLSFSEFPVWFGGGVAGLWESFCFCINRALVRTPGQSGVLTDPRSSSSESINEGCKTI